MGAFQSAVTDVNSWFSNRMTNHFAGAVNTIASSTPTVVTTPTIYNDGNDGLSVSNAFNDDVLDMQKNLAALGYDLEAGKQFVNNGVDGIYGDVTKAAVTQFQTDYGLEPTGIASAETLAAMEQRALGQNATYKMGMQTHDRNIFEAARDLVGNAFHSAVNSINNSINHDVHSTYAYSENTKYIMNTGSPETLSYIEMAKEAAIAQGLDPVLFVNQLGRESNFDPQANSGKAVGIGQFTPETGARYGLTGSDFHDPQKSITAAAEHMRDLTEKYGSQELALVAYNGGPDAISSAARQIGIDVTDMTATNFLDAMAERYAARTSPPPNSVWDVETAGYLKAIMTPEEPAQAQTPTLMASHTPAVAPAAA